MPVIGLIGFGEAGRAFAQGWAGSGVLSAAPRTYDIKLDRPDTAPDIRDAARAAGVVCAGSAGGAASGAAALFSLVTADKALDAAASVAAAIGPGVLFLDCNSCAPSTKARAATLIDAAGGCYVDVAVMAPVHPRRHRTPLLVSGPRARAALELLGSLGMDAREAGDKVGQASSIKMLRSVTIKGLEALTAECLIAARRAGVETAVLASLQESDPGFDWTARSAYNLERMMVHGVRRAAEMDEAARTVADLGLPARMSAAIAGWQRQVGALGLDGGEASLAGRADRILDRLRS